MLKSSSLLSVITVSYNDLDRLKVTVNSLLLSDSRLEHLIVLPENDSISIEFLDEVIRKYPERVIAYIHDAGHGIYEAMEFGALHIKSKYFTFWNAGDALYSKDEMRKMLDTLERTENEWILTNGFFSWISYARPTLANLRAFILQEKGGYVSHQCVILKRSIVGEFKLFNPWLRVAADTDQIYRLYKSFEPLLLNNICVSVEYGKYSGFHQRRARLEILIIILMRLKGMEQFIALKNFASSNINALRHRFKI